MLDPEMYAEFEAWKERKLTGSIDLSIHAFNTEMSAQAIAWDEGVKFALRSAAPSDVEAFLAKNPYRAPGMRGELPVSETRRVTSEPLNLIETTKLTDAERHFGEVTLPRDEVGSYQPDDDPWTE